MEPTSEPVLYHIPPTKLIPNSRKPLLLFKKAFLRSDGKVDATVAFDALRKNLWEVQWVTRYGREQRSHYHGRSHEVMVVLSGPGRIRWGVADLSDNWEEHTYGTAYEAGGVEVEVEAGDMFVIPAGVAHKSFDPSLYESNINCTLGSTGTECLTGSGRGIVGPDPRTDVAKVPLNGFVMMGAYPRGFSWTWDEGGDSNGDFESVWNIPNPEFDPVVGDKGGILKYWKNEGGNL